MLMVSIVMVAGAWVCAATMGIAGFVAWIIFCNVAAVYALRWMVRKLNEEGVLQ